MSLKTSPARCLRCGDPHTEGDGGWNADWRQGRGHGLVCPTCQTPEEAAEASVKTAYLDYDNAAVGSDGAARVAPFGGWHSVQAAHHPVVDNPAIHLAVTAEKSRLLIAVAAHSDAALQRVFADGPCSTVAREALDKAGAVPRDRRIAVRPLDGWPHDSVMVAEDHALAADGEDRGELVLGFAREMNPHLLDAFAPWAADAMRRHMNTVPERGPAALESITASALPAPRLGRPPAAPDEGLVVGGPAWQRFWFGPASQGTAPATDFDFTTALKQFRSRVMNDSGAAQVLAQEHGLHWEDLPADQQEPMHIPGRASADPGLDVAALMLRTRTEDWTWDGAYARVTPHRLTEDLTDLHSTDVSALRWGLVAPRAFTPDRRISPQSRSTHALAAVTTTAAYLAVDHTHFIPEYLALDVATTAALSANNRAALRLPGPWTMVLHEPVPLAAVHADDEGLDALLGGDQIPQSSHAVLGGVLAAHPDHTIDTTLGLILMTAVHAQRGRQWYLQPAAYGAHGAGRLLYSYAAQLAFAKWRKPPAPPAQERGKPGSTKALKRLAKHPDARAGALHRMNILDYTPPPAEPRPEADTASAPGTGLEYGTWRRAKWTERTRIGIRDENDRLVGPVYKDGAIEGETYTRGSVFRPRTRVRPDLPLRPDTRTVYRLRDTPPAEGPTGSATS
ncbi:hypothetical protein OG413_45225 [Streptomyces sp. NBC_01433]|uniref:hypothetical protein n=1 Tax=Streptomyces sp. NBC_01433 TaxID=2903864 RepID=UPI00224CCA5F|nr:hypothetical protein [Streptomyces sp. NBC_01433]MCX4681312.1 hypothetical protein [Streptomyces sp. NBC_01433]MCX4682389.1 hypothetical protein [Streptomyces sp. NBC_01433]